MASVARHINRLNALANGPGAIKLHSVKYIKLSLRSGSKSTGATAFRRTTLPQIQFHNPEVPIAVQREFNSKNLDLLGVQLEGGSEVKIDISALSSQAILDALIDASGASRIEEENIPQLKLPAVHEL